MKLIECPRDAMQGIHAFIPTAEKIKYLNTLLSIGFDTLDFGSFVSPKAIPQMADTAEVLAALDTSATTTRLLAIVANTRGAEEAVTFEKISFLGFPLSISETFQKRNTNKSIAEAFQTVRELQELCVSHHKELVTYLSMGFGNPYGDSYDETIVLKFVDDLASLGVRIVSLADTIGTSNPRLIDTLFKAVTARYPELEVGVHLHSTAATAREKIEAALDAGCQRLDGALRGFGGCPMAADDLVGNIATETIVAVLEARGMATNLDSGRLLTGLKEADGLFSAYH